MTVPCLVLRNRAGNKFFFFTVHMYPCERKIRSPNGSFAPQKRAAHTCIIFLRSKTASVLLLSQRNQFFFFTLACYYVKISTVMFY